MTLSATLAAGLEIAGNHGVFLSGLVALGFIQRLSARRPRTAPTNLQKDLEIVGTKEKASHLSVNWLYGTKPFGVFRSVALIGIII